MAVPSAPEVRTGLPIVAYLAFGISALVIASIGGVLLVTLSIASRNTVELLDDKSRLLISGVAQQVRLFLEPAEAQVEALARLVERGRLDPNDPTQLFDALQAGLAASPHVRSVVYLDRSGWLMAAIRSGATPVPEVADWRHDLAGRAAVGEALDRPQREAYWGPPVYLKDPGVTVVNLRRPVVVRGRTRGVIASTISVRELSRFVTSLETELGQNAFVLYERDLVLAHSALAADFPDLGVARPLPGVQEIGDPVLFGIWREGWQDRRLDGDVLGHTGRVGDAQYIYLYQALEPPLDPRWLVGSYFADETLDAPLDRLTLAAGLGLGALVVAVIAALLLGRRVSRPIGQLAAAANAIRTLDLDEVAPLRRSRLKEIDQAAIAFNAMVRALRVAAVYLPRQIVHGLISRGVAAALVSEQREVTVLFTDIVEFTTRTETLPADETAAFLNHHFGLLTGAIEAEDGMVDKFIGDAMMALWNGIDEQQDHALRAVRAARSIVAAVRRDNAGREVPVQLRIGLHSGRVVVGNIGSSSRMNYTVVGDTVNTAQRLEALAKELLPDADIPVLLSETTVAALPPDLPVRALGRHRLRGRGEPLEVFALVV
jgi:class 3 adenylate cyclase